MSQKYTRKYTPGQKSYSRSFHKTPLEEDLGQEADEEGNKRAREAWGKVYDLLLLTGKYPIGYLVKGTTSAVVNYAAWKEAWQSFRSQFIKFEENIRRISNSPFDWGVRCVDPSSLIDIHSTEFSNWLWTFIVANCTRSNGMISLICQGLQEKGLSDEAVEGWKNAIIAGEFPDDGSLLPDKMTFVEAFLDTGAGLSPGELSEDFEGREPRYSNMLTGGSVIQKRKAKFMQS